MIKMKEAGQTVLKFGSGAAGMTVGSLAMKQVNKLLPASFPDIAKKIGPGLAAMLLAYLVSAKFSNDKVKALAMGLGLAGFADLALKVLGNVKLIADNVPSLSGLPGYRSVSTDPAIGWDYYQRNSVQGLAGDPYALNGDNISTQGIGNAFALSGGTFSMQGPGGNMSAMAPYALN